MPRGHTRAVLFVDPAGQAYPAVQLPLQPAVDNPTVDPNVPAGHELHWGEASILKEPAPHKTIVLFVDPGGQAYPARHPPLHAAVDRPVAAPNVPPGHNEQEVPRRE